MQEHKESHTKTQRNVDEAPKMIGLGAPSPVEKCHSDRQRHQPGYAVRDIDFHQAFFYLTE